MDHYAPALALAMQTQHSKNTHRQVTTRDAMKSKDATRIENRTNRATAREYGHDAIGVVHTLLDARRLRASRSM